MLLHLVLVSIFFQNHNRVLISVYQPTEGDRVFSHSERTPDRSPLLKEDFLFDDFDKSETSRDEEGITAIEKKGQLIYLPEETALRVLDMKRFPEGKTHKSFVEVRVLDGRYKDQKGYIPLTYLAQEQPNRGDRGILSSGGDNSISVFTTISDMQFVERAKASGESERDIQLWLFDNPRMIKAAQNTKISVIMVHSRKRLKISQHCLEFRFEEGPLKGRRGYAFFSLYKRDKQRE